jgi:protein-S-isoprenylcysteine O-methyltransferase Ste14
VRPPTQEDAVLKRWIVFIYGVASYLVFFATFLYAVGFVGNAFVPRSIDGPMIAGFGESLAIDLALLAAFALQHSIMARRPFKRWLVRRIPEAAERSTYVLAASIALAAVFAFWHPLGGTIWHVEGGAAYALLALCGFGWLLVLVATFLIDHFDLFGLRQVWLYFNWTAYRPVAFRTPGPYRLVRHPLYAGFLIAFWATPTMTVTHLVFASVTAIYIVAAIQLEERDLVDQLGATYRAYQQRVPMLIPFSRKDESNPTPSPQGR